MKFKIYGEKKSTEKTVTFGLRIDSDGDLLLYTADEKGNKITDILFIDSDNGTLNRYNGLPKNIGLAIDDDERIYVEN